MLSLQLNLENHIYKQTTRRQRENHERSSLSCQSQALSGVKLPRALYWSFLISNEGLRDSEWWKVSFRSEMAGQTINDRLLAAKHSLAGQGLAKSVCKATTEELLGPKKKHLDYLVHCTNEPNVSIPQMANLLMERSQNTSWVVVYKALITAHHIMCYGNERFTQYLASSNVSFQLNNFVDKSGVQSAVGARTGYDMSPFIRRYAKYLNEKALSYRAVAFDFCKVKRGKDEGTLRTMNAENLLKTVPVLQTQLDALLEFDCTANDLTNGVINMSFMLLFRDLIRLFASYNDGIINLLEKYFEMNKKQCREALDLYKKFLIRMDRVGEFLKVAENIGIDKGDIPDLTRAPNSLLDTLEAHLASLEGNTPTTSSQKSLKSGVSMLNNTSNSFANSNFDENIQKSALNDEEAALNAYKANVSSPGASTNPFLTQDAPPQPKSNDAILDLFGGGLESTAAPVAAPKTNNAIDDLLGLGANPFGDVFGSSGAPVADATATNMFGTAATDANSANWANGFATQPAAQYTAGNTANNLVTGIFNTNEPSVFDPLGGGLTDANIAQNVAMSNAMMTGAPAANKASAAGKILTGDLESSLASLAENLTIDTSRSTPVQWSSPKNQPKQGNWQPQPMAATTNLSYRPMGQVGAPNPQQPNVFAPGAVPQQPPAQDMTFDPFGAL